MPDTHPTRVVKLGGSLLDLPDLVARLRRWIARQSPARHVIVVGGGPFVDALRDLQSSLWLDDGDVHWLAIRAMSLTARVVRAASAAAGHPWPLVETIAEAADHDTVLLDVETMLRQADGGQLPEDWSVTSDSIAAWVAIEAVADELVLLKSRLAAMAPHFVDTHFDQLMRRLPRCRVVHFRSPGWDERVVHPPGSPSDGP